MQHVHLRLFQDCLVLVPVRCHFDSFPDKTSRPDQAPDCAPCLLFWGVKAGVSHGATLIAWGDLAQNDGWPRPLPAIQSLGDW